MTAFSTTNRVSLTPLLLPLVLYLLPYISSDRPTVTISPSPTTTTTASITLTPAQVALLSTTVAKRLRTLSNITSTPPFTNRPYLSTASNLAQTQISSWMQSASLSTTIDAAGNVIGDLLCTNAGTPRNKIMLGSHHDTVAQAGRFDGLLGVVSAISVAQILSQRICSLPFDIRVIAFDDEEGNNLFGSTNLGARAYTGTIDWEHHIADKQAFIQHYRHLYHVPDPITAIESAKGETPLAYLELHLEQGPVLERRQKSVGLVDAIAGQTRLRVKIKGEAGHAGTVPMAMRHDALVTAAEGIVAVEKVPKGVVGTVGKLSVSPGVGNVIPGEVVLSVDVRSANDRQRENSVERIVKKFVEAGSKRGVGVAVEVLHDVSAVGMSDWIMKELKGLRDVDGGVVTSGAGHDAQIMAGVTDVGMLFVRCRNGVSHRPDEFVSDEDIFRGSKALLNAVLAIAQRVWNGKYVVP